MRCILIWVGVFVWIALNFDKHNLEEVNQSYRDNDWSFFKRDELAYLLDLNNKTKSDVLLELIKNSYGLSDDEVSFIKNNASKFQDNIYSFVGYFGDESKEFYIDTGKQNEMFSWVGDMTIRRGCISYVDVVMLMRLEVILLCIMIIGLILICLMVLCCGIINMIMVIMLVESMMVL